MDTVDYSPYNIPNPDPAKTYAIKYPGLVQATQDTDNTLITAINTAQGSSASLAIRLDEMDADIHTQSAEITLARNGEASLHNRLNQFWVAANGLNQNLAANGHKITHAADAEDAQDLTTLSQVNALISLGGSPHDVNILEFASPTMNNGEWIYKSGGNLVAIDSVTARTELDVPSNSELSESVENINQSMATLKPTIANALLYS